MAHLADLLRWLSVRYATVVLVVSFSSLRQWGAGAAVSWVCFLRSALPCCGNESERLSRNGFQVDRGQRHVLLVLREPGCLLP